MFTEIEGIFVRKDHLHILEACIKISEPSLLVGETGTGKTSIVQKLANRDKKNLIRVSVNGSTGIEEIIGKWLVSKGSTYWQDGILINAMKNGDWIVFDEINAALPEILFSLHSLLDDDRRVILVEKSNEVLRPHEDFRFFATMNPSEEYSGTKDVNRALLSRFNSVIYFEHPQENIEVKILNDRTKIETGIALNLVRLANELRKMKRDGDLYYYCSTRDLIHASKLIQNGVAKNDAVFASIANKMTKDEIKECDKTLKKYIEFPVTSMKSYEDMEKEIIDLKASLEKSKNETDAIQKKMNEEVSKALQLLIAKFK